MATDQDRICIRIGIDSPFQSLGQIFLKRGVFNDRNTKRIVVVVHSFSFPARDPLDLLDVADLKIPVLAMLALYQERHEHGPLRVCMYAAHGAAFEGSQKQRGAIGWLKVFRLANVFSL